MNTTVILIFQIILALWFIFPGYMKLTTPKNKMIATNQLPPDGNPLPIRILGFLELLGVVGILVPTLTNTLPIIPPITAVCFAIVMIGAFVVHYKKREFKVLPLMVVAFVLAVVVAWVGFDILLAGF